MKYKCLVLDHDDTVVDSTATIHFPCFAEYLWRIGSPLAGTYTLEEYFVKNFSPGITALLTDEVGLSPDELIEEERYWRDYVKNHVPRAYPKIGEVMRRFKELGGIIAVNSHSYKSYIERDYEKNALPKPDIIFGWDLPAEERKPSPHTVFELMRMYSLAPEDIIVVDDLKPGYDMARGAGVDFAAAGWAYNISEIEEFMRENCDYYLKSIEELEELLFGE